MDPVQQFLATEIAQDYRTGLVTRREFLRRLALITGGAIAASSLAWSLACAPEAAVPAAMPSPTALPPTATSDPTPSPTPTPGPGETVAPHDPRIQAGPVQFEANGVTVRGYLSRPAGDGPHPAVLVIHENRGLLPHFPDLTRRLALEGYAAFALDLLSRKGGSAGFPDSGAMRTALREVTQEQAVEDMNASVAYLQAQPFVRPDRIGATGFCYGGGMVWLLAARNPQVRAAVPFYGAAPPLEEVPNIQAAVLGIYAAEDNRINAGVPDLEAALKEHGTSYTFNTYAGANHAFFNDTGTRYHPESAQAAWMETLAWFDQHLKA